MTQPTKAQLNTRAAFIRSRIKAGGDEKLAPILKLTDDQVCRLADLVIGIAAK